MKDLPAEKTAALKAAFSKMMRALYRHEGASFKVEIMRDDDVRSFIDEHSSVLDSSFEKARMSDAMRRRLQQSDYVFSGIKTFHELKEAFPSLLDEKGERKPFERFLNDVQKIDRTYNRNYLRTEYNFVSASSEMAGRWEDFEKDGDEYWLQYRTAGDDRVRPEHAALNGVTLPPSDPFWDIYYPPNGWNCRCTVVQVSRQGRTQTTHDEAMSRGAQALRGDKRHMFAWNPGKERKSVPDYNPYTISRCRTCDVAKGKMNLSKPLDNDLCKTCRQLRSNVPDDVTELLKSLHEVTGAEYIKKLRKIVNLRIFQKTDMRNVWSAIDENSPDYGNLFSAAGKLADHGFEVFILPDPKSTRSGDYILKRKNFVRAFDLKTITGFDSAGNRLSESIGQANNVVLNIRSRYNAHDLGESIKGYFEINKAAQSVIILKGRGKYIEVTRNETTKKFIEHFSRLYGKNK